MRDIKLAFYLSAILCFALFIRGCQTISFRDSWGCSNSENQLTCNYQSLIGQKTKIITLETVDSLEIYYQVQIESNELSIILQNPNKETIWEDVLMQSATKMINLVICEKDNFHMTAQGSQIDGKLSIDWKINE